MHFKTVTLKEDDTAKGEFIGYASTWTRVPDSYGDVVAKGAFVQTLKEWAEKGQPIPVLWGHRMDDPDFFLGVVLEAKEDAHGLWVRVALDLDNAKAAQVYRLLKAKAVAQMSFAFDILDDATVQVEGGEKARELRAVTLYEVSVVPIGANPDTSIESVKADNGSTGGEFTVEQVEALRALAGEWIAAHDDDPPEGEGDSNTNTAETTENGGKAAWVEAVARIATEIDALKGQEGD